MPLVFGPNFVEGKVYRSRRRNDEDDEKQALRELQAILAVKNRRPCDCEAQIHDLLENCLSCGRLTCIAEGPGKCVSCGNIVLSQEQRATLGKHIDILHSIPATSSQVKQASGPRTRIIDNQFDHFAIDNKKHLREEDRRKQKEDLEELQAKRYQRKLLLDVDVDRLEAGSRSTPQIEDYEAELRKLQLNHQPAETSSNFTLAELVLKEFKNNYAFEYIDTNESIKNRPKQQSAKSEGVKINVGASFMKQKQQQQSKTRQQNRPGPKSKGDKRGSSIAPVWNNNNSNKDKNK